MPRSEARSIEEAARLRAAILAAAEGVFARHGQGPEDTRLDEVAQVAGITRASLGAYFPDAPALHAALLADVFADLHSRYSRALVHATTNQARIERLLDEWVRFCVERPAFLPLVMRELSGSTVLPPDELRRGVRPVLEQLRAVIRAGQRDGTLRRADATQFIFLVSGVSAFLLVAAPALSPEEYPDGIQPFHVERLRTELLRLGHVILGAPRTPPRAREDAP